MFDNKPQYPPSIRMHQDNNLMWAYCDIDDNDFEMNT